MTNKEHPPYIFAVFKPTRVTSQNVVAHFKKNLPYQKLTIGHFGTLDPFASGLLLIGMGGASRLNDFIHSDLPKTYLAVGKLGIETDSGDYTGKIVQTDETQFAKNLSHFSKKFIEDKLKEKFLGDYWQAPHKISAAKFQGKPLHEWTRMGVEIPKEKKLRHIYDLEVVKFQFPYLSIRFSVSSGTYIRTLFSECANYLGTLGTLVALVREKIGSISIQEALKKNQWPQNKQFVPNHIPLNQILPFHEITFSDENIKLFKNGAFIDQVCEAKVFWIKNEKGQILGLGEKVEEKLKAKINFQFDF
jgi:tRNA pseudouridine55 synthase